MPFQLLRWLEEMHLTLQSKPPFYDGLLPDEGYREVTRRNSFRRSLKLFKWLWKNFLTGLGLQNNCKKFATDDLISANERRQSSLSASSVKPHDSRGLTRKNGVTLH